MALKFSNLFFVEKNTFTQDRQHAHEAHHRNIGWVYYCTMLLGFWLIASPPSFGYEQSTMIWSDILTGFFLMVFSYLALNPYKLWAQWSLVFLGVWLLIAPMIFWAEEEAGFHNNYLVGILVVVFGIIVPGQPGLKLFERPGPDVPPGWSYNPSTWNQRLPVIFLSWVGFFVARYMGAYQMDYITTVWDPFFGDGTRKVLTSEVSKSFPVSDAMLGAFSYVMDILFGCAGGINRWRTMPWVVIIFAILIIPLGVVSITLVILQPVSVGYWCTLCLTSALISMLMIPFTIDEAVATIQMMRAEKRAHRTSYWTTFWFGGTMQGGKEERAKSPAALMEFTGREMFHDLTLRPWNLALALVLGGWVMSAYSTLGYQGTIMYSENITGSLIITFAVIAMSEVGRPLRFILMLFGLWLIAAPWIVGTEENAALWNGMICGAILIPLALPRGKVEDKRGSIDKYII
ncbi:vitamin K epoxide reductase family protein [Telluribacter sp. SYSU D00476]|uniref:SPW repeat domain-containing protein n=1 Tax=Telluribacter sp. SYSU D00476 TaxID=2811430 RepID=UPI001FF6E335|nr:vitamin K epoxide reductase family protein [Telluribacter sp. SYSU D00476]